MYNTILETRYAPGGSGYIECKAEFNQYSTSTHQDSHKQM